MLNIICKSIWFLRITSDSQNICRCNNQFSMANTNLGGPTLASGLPSVNAISEATGKRSEGHQPKGVQTLIQRARPRRDDERTAYLFRRQNEIRGFTTLYINNVFNYI